MRIKKGTVGHIVGAFPVEGENHVFQKLLKNMIFNVWHLKKIEKGRNQTPSHSVKVRDLSTELSAHSTNAKNKPKYIFFQ